VLAPILLIFQRKKSQSQSFPLWIGLMMGLRVTQNVSINDKP